MGQIANRTPAPLRVVIVNGKRRRALRQPVLGVGISHNEQELLLLTGGTPTLLTIEPCRWTRIEIDRQTGRG